VWLGRGEGGCALEQSRILDEVNLSEAVLEPAVANVLDYVAAWNEPDAAHS
jgi:hypothetical protein